MQISVSSWLVPVVAASSIAASPVAVPVMTYSDIQIAPVALTTEIVPADLLEALGAVDLSADGLGDAVGGLFGFGYLFADVLIAFNQLVSMVLAPISWIPFIGPFAVSLIWFPINLVESVLWNVLVGPIYYPYGAEATDISIPSDLTELSFPDTALTIDAVEVEAFAVDALPDLGEIGGAVQEAGLALLDLIP